MNGGMRRLGEMLSVLVALVVVSPPCFGGWAANGIPVCTAAEQQTYPVVTSDGAHGAIIAWQDTRSGFPQIDIYAQRVDSSGVVQWNVNGVALCTAPGRQLSHVITSDSTGGAIVAWQDNRTGSNQIYAQRVSASGVVEWDVNGVILCTAPGWQSSPAITSDGVGGAIVAWNDGRDGSNRIYAQRVNTSGDLLWGADGEALCVVEGSQQEPVIMSDGAGGVIVTWSDLRSGDVDVYAQRISASGDVQWDVHGVALCTASGEQSSPVITSDGDGGAIVAWNDGRDGSLDVYAQRVSAWGNTLWTANGVDVCTGELDQYLPAIVTDGTQGAIIAWSSFDPVAMSAYAQRVDKSGVILWGGDGVRLWGRVQSAVCMISDGVGGAIMAWANYPVASASDIIAGRVSANGVSLWRLDVCTVGNEQWSPYMIPDGARGAIIAWSDDRCFFCTDIYAQRVCSNGTGPTSIILASAAATVGGGCVTLSWQTTECLPASSFCIQRSESLEGESLPLGSPISVRSGSWFTCADCSVQPGQTYWYRIVLVSASGADEEVYGPIEVRVAAVPTAYEAYQGYPNPFNPVCMIRYDLPQPGMVTLRVFDVNGTSVRTLVDGFRATGVYREVWDGTADDGTALSSGVYFYRLEAGDFVATRKMVLLR